MNHPSNTFITWLFNKGPLPSNAIVNNDRLDIFNIRMDNSGIYSCKVTYRGGQIMDSGRLEVFGKN